MSQTLLDRACGGRDAALRLVMLPPAYTGPHDFVRAGFVSAVRARSLDIDLVFADLRLEHVTDRSAPERLYREHIQPAAAAGCAVWLGGISLGGYLALCVAERHTSELAGLCLFAPYLGSHLTTGEIERAGGVAAWDPGVPAEEDDERRVWRFIRAVRAGAPAVHLGFGREDRFAARHRLLAAALPEDNVDVVAGGHDWPTWQLLWERFLERRLRGGALAKS